MGINLSEIKDPKLRERYEHALSLGSNKSRLNQVVNEGKRIRQDSKPLMNKLEAEWFEIINVQFLNFPRPRAQAKRYRLGNGVVFTPDFTASVWPNLGGGNSKETAWEVKGKMAWDDAIVKIKLAPTIWPEVQWLFCWKENGQWKTQIVLP